MMECLIVSALAMAAAGDGKPSLRPHPAYADVFCMLAGDKLLQVNGVNVSPKRRAADQAYRKHRCDTKVDVVVRRAGAISAFACKPPTCAASAGTVSDAREEGAKPVMVTTGERD